MFKTIEENVRAEIVEKKSKFMAHAFYVESVEQAEELIKQTNKKYFDARHNCYAFRVMTQNGVINRFSDDGEPSGTAGRTDAEYFDFAEFGKCIGSCNTLFWRNFAGDWWTCESVFFGYIGGVELRKYSRKSAWQRD